MKLRIAIIAVMVSVAAGLYLYSKQSPTEKTAHEVEESVLPNDSDNSDFDNIPTQQDPKSPERVPPVYFPKTVVALEKQLTPALPPADRVEMERIHEL